MELLTLLSEYKKLPLNEVLDHEKFKLISIDHHSTRIEGSTLTEVETQVLIKMKEKHQKASLWRKA